MNTAGKHGCHKSHLAIYFFKRTHVALGHYFYVFFRATPAHIAKQRIAQQPSPGPFAPSITSPRGQRHIGIEFQTATRDQKDFHLPRAKRWLKAYSCRAWLYVASPMVFLAYIFMARQYETVLPQHLFSPLLTFAFV